VLLAGAGAGVAVVAGGAAAQQAPVVREKGPHVWLDLDQKELDDAYDQAVYAPNRDVVLKRCSRNSELVRERLGAPKRFAYGPTPIEGLDLFATKAANAPVHVFIHGGAWRVGLAKNYCYAAEMFVNAGAAVEAFGIREIHRCDGACAELAASSRQAQRSGGYGVRDRGDPRSSSGRAAISPPSCGRPASRCRSPSWKATTISR
jgi:arylformamidase